MNYGAYQESVSRALNNLLRSQDSESQQEVILQCREHALTALQERLRYLGARYETEAEGHRSVHPLGADSLTRQPLHHLAELLHSLPRTGPSAVAPSDLLPGPPAHTASTTADRWRSVARDLMLGNTELTGAVEQPWLTRNNAGWYLVGDAAATIEAIVVLDQHLSRSGALPTTSDRRVLARRLVAGDVARLARWFGTDNAPDRATRAPDGKVGLDSGPRVRMIRRASDYATAQRALAGFLHVARADHEPGPPEERPGLLAARTIAAGQIHLAEAFAHWSDRVPAGSLLGEQFRNRIPALQALHRSTTRLTEIEPRRSPLAVAQQTEMITQLRKLATPPRLSRTALLDLNEATHELTVTLGRALRKEGMQRKNILILLQPEDLGLPQPRPITSSRNPFHTACKTLADDPRPASPHESWAAPIEREKLRVTLDQFSPGTAAQLRRMPPQVPRETPQRRQPTQGTKRNRHFNR